MIRKSRDNRKEKYFIHPPLLLEIITLYSGESTENSRMNGNILNI